MRVRRRQNVGVDEILHLYQDIIDNDDKLPVSILGKLKLALRNPLSFAFYASVQTIVKFFPANSANYLLLAKHTAEPSV